MINATDRESDNDGPAAARRATRKQAMDLLARREHAPAELEAKLRKRGHAAEAIAGVLDDLAQENLLSAERYAQTLVASKGKRGIGPMRLRSELAAAGIDDTLIERALAEAEIDWCELARAARHKRFGVESPADFKSRAKQMRFLQQRGFDGDQIQAAFE